MIGGHADPGGVPRGERLKRRQSRRKAGDRDDFPGDRGLLSRRQEADPCLLFGMRAMGAL